MLRCLSCVVERSCRASASRSLDVTRIRDFVAVYRGARIVGRLLVATDRLSIKPVLWHAADGRLVFASEVKPLAAAGVPLAVNGRRVYEYLQSGALDHSRDTLFDGIQQLRPGTFLTWQDGSVTESRYWDLSASDADDQRGDVLVDAIDATLQEAVDLHLRGDVEPALSLSSGLDSQVLRALIQRDGRRDGRSPDHQRNDVRTEPTHDTMSLSECVLKDSSEAGKGPACSARSSYSYAFLVTGSACR